MKTMRFLGVVMILALAAPALAEDEMVDNPEYASWAKHQPGTTVTLQTQTAMQGMNMTNDMTHTLKSVADDKAVVETTITMNMGGMKNESKQTREVAKKVKKGQENMPADMKGTCKEAGSESVSAAGKTYECKKFEFTGETQGTKTAGKVWNSPDMPGGTVKMEMKMEGGANATMTTTVTAVDVK